MWTLVLITLAANAGGVHSTSQMLQFPTQEPCEKAANELRQLTISIKESDLAIVAKCVQLR